MLKKYHLITLNMFGAQSIHVMNSNVTSSAAAEWIQIRWTQLGSSTNWKLNHCTSWENLCYNMKGTPFQIPVSVIFVKLQWPWINWQYNVSYHSFGQIEPWLSFRFTLSKIERGRKHNNISSTVQCPAPSPMRKSRKIFERAGRRWLVAAYIESWRWERGQV